MEGQRVKIKRLLWLILSNFVGEKKSYERQTDFYRSV